MLFKTLTKNLFRLASATLVGGLLASNSQLSTLNFQLNKPAFAAPSYSVGFTTDKAQAAHGETVTYSLIVTNNGDVNLTNFNVYQATRPSNTSYVNGSGVVTDGSGSTNIADVWFSDPAGTNLGSLTPGQAMTFKWSVKVDDNAPQTQVITESINFKTAELQEPRGATANFTVAINASRNSLCSNLTANTSNFAIGDTVTYKIHICNDGDLAQTNVLVADALPREVTYKAGSTVLNIRGQNITVPDAWIGKVGAGDGTFINLGTLNSTETADITFQATVNSGLTDGQVIRNVGQVKSDQKPEWQQCAADITIKVPSIVTNPNCSVTKKIRLPNGNEVTSVSAGDHVYAPGEEIVYRLFVSNSGNGDANNFSLSDFLPTYVFWTSGDGGYSSNDNKVNFDLGTLKGGESRTLTYKAKVRDNIPSGQVSQTNNAKVTSPSNLTCTSSSTLTIGKPGAILAATALPQTGGVPTSVLGTLGLVLTGIIARLRKFKTTRYWGK